MGFTVVGKPAATVMTSSPGLSCRSPSVGEVSTETATRFAEEPEFTSRASRTPTNFANLNSNRSANRPAVSQKSSPDSTMANMSLSSKTRPETGTGDSPGVNVSSGKTPCNIRLSAAGSRLVFRSFRLMLIMHPTTL
jgi:hypothetical protein